MEHLLEINDTDHGETQLLLLLFTNSDSGSRIGDRIINSSIKSIVLGQEYNSQTHFFAINRTQSRKVGLTFLNKCCESPQYAEHKIIVLAGGGDGTVNWLINELVQWQANFSRFYFGAFPLGTGNDFASHLGWAQINILDNGFEGLKRLVVLLKAAEIHTFDIWDATIQTKEQGNIYKKKLQPISIAKKDEETTKTIKMTKRFNNYFSLGMDARVGYDFDIHRSRSQWLNYIIYFFIGCCNHFRKIEPLSRVIQRMEQSKASQLENSSSSVTIFSSINHYNVPLKQNYRNIVALNINFYMGGVKDIWKHTHKKAVGVDQLLYEPTHHSDGKLEFVSFKDQWSLGFERYFRGRARKITQGEGPFKFEFNPNCKQSYINLDGQYYKLQEPRSIYIEKSKYFAKCPLRVLVNRR